ncbi:MAG: hypothetical protein KDA25_04045 [Phycisphaerales bacterium]|nr:hypothetical protein [Phycisphaerales bacterium]
MPPISARTVDPIRLLRRYAWLLIGAAFVGGVLGVAIYFALGYFMPGYEGTILFRVQPGLAAANEIGERDFRGADAANRIARTEVIALRDRAVLRAAVKDRSVQTDTRWIRGFMMSDGSIDVDAAVDELEEDLVDVFPRQTLLFGVRWEAASPSDVPIVLNAISKQYLDVRSQRNVAAYAANLKLFQKQLDETVSDINAIQTEISQFIRDKGITSVDDMRSHQLTRAMEDIVSRREEAKSNYNMVFNRARLVEEKLVGTIQPTEEDRAAAVMNSSVRPLEQMVVAARLQLRRANERYKDPNHPEIRQIELQLRTVEQEYEAKLADIMRENLQAQQKELRTQIETWDKQAKRLDTEYDEKDAQLRELAASYNDFRAKEERQRSLERSREEFEILIREVKLMQTRDDATQVQLSAPAIQPRIRSFPRLPIVLPLTVMAVVGLVLGIVLLRELSDQRVKTAADLTLMPGIRVVGVVPEMEDDPTGTTAVERVVSAHPTSVLAESYRQVATPIFKAMERSELHSLLLLGGLPGAGSTTVATNLAATKAAEGRRIVIIDANFRRPHLADVFGRPADAPGLGDLLAGTKTLDDVLLDVGGGISIIPAGSPSSRIVERLNSEPLDALLAELRSRADFVIVDAPPTVAAGDGLVLANKVDAAVLVVRANQEHRGLVARVLWQLDDTQCEVIGVMLNRARMTVGGYFRKNFLTMAEYSQKDKT